MSEDLKLGEIITKPQTRDAVHIAVAPVVAGEILQPGSKIGFVDKQNNTVSRHGPTIGVVDPFLKFSVAKGQTFWMYLIPGSIQSLRHEWEHPDFDRVRSKDDSSKSFSETWMRNWAKKHLTYQYGEYVMDDNSAYQYAIRSGEDLNVGSFEDARDYIDDEWWNHWESITGKTGRRDDYFRCAC